VHERRLARAAGEVVPVRPELTAVVDALEENSRQYPMLLELDHTVSTFAPKRLHAAAQREPALLVVAALSLWAASCATPQRVAARVPVASWGTMREALRDGRTEPRVALAGLAARSAVGVGALAGLAGEVTIADGRVLVATAEGEECRVAEAEDGAAATLLVRAEVEQWQEWPLPDCATYRELDSAVAARLRQCGFDPTQPTPIRVRGRGTRVEYHVVAGACPIANPSGPPPWRFAGPLEHVELIGFYVEGAAGRWTHHTASSHLHVVAPGRMGHLDDLALADAVLLVPAAP
jgi:hypothetical protein